MSEWTDEQLVAEAQTGLRGQGASVEAMRRLRIAIDKLDRNGRFYSRVVVVLTVVIALLTLVLAVPVVRDWGG